MSTTRISLDSPDIPGQRGRLLALGTSMGTILLYNVRANIPPTNLPTSLFPLRMIHTSSPSISTLALSSLYLVHGGTDGLVQAWDPLASSLTPIRTLHSRFSSRARRRLAQAVASPAGVGINLFAAGAICLDPNPTVLRGLVSLGTHLFYWHFSSSAADAYRSHKRRVRCSERMRNSGGEKFVPAPRQGGTRRFIENEKWELEREEEREQRERDRVGRRFGTDLLGESATEEEMLAYAALLSEEAFVEESGRRESETLNSKSASSSSSSSSEMAQDGARHGPVRVKVEEDYDEALAEAIRLSLATSTATASGLPDNTLLTSSSSSSPSSSPIAHYMPDGDDNFGVPIRYVKTKKRTTPPRTSPRFDAATVVGGGDDAREKAELEFALEISMAEERSRREVEGEGEEFPGLPSERERGKGKERSA